MELKWMVVGAIALVPCAAMAQSKAASDSSSSRRDSSAQRTTSTSTGDVSSSSTTNDPNVTQAMLQAQNNPNMVGTPAWWKNHGTADGKPPIQRSGSTH
jgi:hypothetical protein